MVPNPEALHARLSAFAAQRLQGRLPEGDFRSELEEEMSVRVLEEAFVSEERAAIAARAAQAPVRPEAFVAWFEDLKATGPGQGDPLFPYLAERATYDEMRWFLKQEVAGEAGFEDLTALTQLKQPARAKLELGRNFWDELGRGNEDGMHGPMLVRLSEHFELDAFDAPIVWEATALGNLLVALAANRRYAFHSLGALGVVELTAPGRAEKVHEGLRRLGVPGRARHYFAVHATLDVKHSEAWNREVIAPLCAANPRTARAMAEGALMRLQAGARCFERYRQELGLARACSDADIRAVS